MTDASPAVCGEHVLFRRVSFDVLQGVRRVPHRATDFFAAEGSHVHAPVDGVVMDPIPRNVHGGNHIRIRGDDGRTRYFSHLRDAPLVRPGDRIVAGQLVGLVGHSGATRVDHLHYSRRVPDGGTFENVFFDQAELASRFGANTAPRPELEWIGAIGCPLEGGAILRPERPELPAELAELAELEPRRVRRLPPPAGGAELDLGGLGRLALTVAAARLLGVG